MRYKSIILLIILIGCQQVQEKKQFIDKELLKQEVLEVEKAFAKMVDEKGLAEAFYYFAAENAVIKRQNDTLITGRENIRDFYTLNDYSHATLKWSPDYVEVSDDGTLAYTYGKYLWEAMDSDSTSQKFTGVFHTVWKRQPDGSWKYVWD